jgi:hypothetical protein
MNRSFLVTLLVLNVSVVGINTAHATKPVPNSAAPARLTHSAVGEDHKSATRAAPASAATSESQTKFESEAPENPIPTPTLEVKTTRVDGSKAVDSSQSITIPSVENGKSITTKIVLTPLKSAGKENGQYDAQITKVVTACNCTLISKVEGQSVTNIATLLGQKNSSNIVDIENLFKALSASASAVQNTNVIATSNEEPKEDEAAKRKAALEKSKMCEGKFTGKAPDYIESFASNDSSDKLNCMKDIMRSMGNESSEASKLLAKKQKIAFFKFIESQFKKMRSKSKKSSSSSSSDVSESAFDSVFSAMEVSLDSEINNKAIEIQARAVAEDERQDALDYRNKKQELITAAKNQNFDEAEILIQDLRIMSEAANDRLDSHDADILANYREMMNDNTSSRGYRFRANDQTSQDLQRLMNNPNTFAHSTRSDIQNLQAQLTQAERQPLRNGQNTLNNSNNVFDVTSNIGNVNSQQNVSSNGGNGNSQVQFYRGTLQDGSLATQRTANGFSGNVPMVPPSRNLFPGGGNNWMQQQPGTGALAVNSVPSANNNLFGNGNQQFSPQPVRTNSGNGTNAFNGGRRG